MTKHADCCWNQDECKICTPNHHEIWLISREAETLAKQTNKTNALWQSTQIVWSAAAKDELICSLCEKTPTIWTPPRWKCSYKWTKRIYCTQSIVMCPSCGAGQWLTYSPTEWKFTAHPKTHHNLFTGNNQLGRQKGRTCLQKDWITCTLHTERRPPVQGTNQCCTKEKGIWLKRRRRQKERKPNYPHWQKEEKHSWILQPNPNNKRHREKAPDRSVTKMKKESKTSKSQHRKTRKTVTRNLETIGLWT